MMIEEQIQQYIATQPAAKQADLQWLHHRISEINRGGKLWFLDGKNAEGKVVSNPNIGYGELQMNYADGSTREFYQVGISANTSGISVYIMGLDDKKYLAETFGERLGKATVTGYCIKFKTLKDINTDVLEEAVRYGFNR